MTTASTASSWVHRVLTLNPRPRGFHLVTPDIVSRLPELERYKVGLAHLMILHTSASLFVNENADPDVRADFESYFRRAIPEGASYRHTTEGEDDMPAHLKSASLGTQLTLPVCDGAFILGTWQGIYLGEHRDRGGARRIAVTLHGETNPPSRTGK